ncbi:MAG: DUF4126 domain-containing protein [Gloeocapsa sp. DLM2.Bin57]|nr:MAG: DUF4126 domain-containing protein [Gloeocapsa sp. DLM2.Bin57]
MIEVLASLSISAAVGMRIALPLLIVGLIRTQELWSDIPILNYFHPQVLLSILVVWSLCELILSKKFRGQRLLQIVQLLFTPIIGALLPVVVIKNYSIATSKEVLIVLSITGAALALAIKLVEVGWFFRLRGLPIAVIIFEDILSILMVLFALRAPEQGGLIAMLLLWIAIRSAGEWRQWYIESRPVEDEAN